jgi:hypothetical protein
MTMVIILTIMILAIISINNGNNGGSNVFIIARNTNSDPIRAQPCNTQTNQLYYTWQLQILHELKYNINNARFLELVICSRQAGFVMDLSTTAMTVISYIFWT